MILSSEDFALIGSYRSLIEGAIRNSSASNIPTELRDAVARILKVKGFKGCSICNSQMYVSLCRVYDFFIKDMMENNAKVAQETEAKKQAKQTKKNAKK